MDRRKKEITLERRSEKENEGERERKKEERRKTEDVMLTTN